MSSEHSITRTESTLKRQWAIWAELVKLRLTVMVLITTGMGFYLASAQAMDWVLLLLSLIHI